MKKIFMKELMLHLNYTDVRSVRAWCIKNNITIVTAGKIEFVFESEFCLAIEQTFINKLKKKFADKWQDVYNLYNEGNITELSLLNQQLSIPNMYFEIKPTKENHFTKKLKNHEKKNAA